MRSMKKSCDTKGLSQVRGFKNHTKRTFLKSLHLILQEEIQKRSTHAKSDWHIFT